MNQEEKQYQTKEFRVIADFLSSITSKLGQVKRVDSMLSSALTDIDDLRRRINSLDQSINITYEAGMKLENEFRELKTRFDNHEKNILRRFKEEILKCLEDDCFKLQLWKAFNKTNTIFKTPDEMVAETPPEKRFGTCFDEGVGGSSKTPKDLYNYHLNDQFAYKYPDRNVDINKTIHENTVIGENPLFSPPSENKNHVPDVGEKGVFIKELGGWFIPND